MTTLRFRRFHINTLLCHQTLVRRRSLVNLFGNIRPINGRGRHTPLKPNVRISKRLILNIMIRNTNNFIRGRRAKILRGNTNSHGSLPLATKRTESPFTSTNIMTRKRFRGRIITTNSFNHFGSKLNVNIKVNRKGIFLGNTLGRRTILKRGTGLSPRKIRLCLASVMIIS